MRICFVERMGISVQCRQVAKHISLLGHSVDLIGGSLSNISEELKKMRGIKIKFPFLRSNTLSFALWQLPYGFISALTIRKFLKHDQYDVIYIEVPTSAFFNFVLNSRKVNAPIIVSWMGPISGLKEVNEHDKKLKNLFIPQEWHIPKVITTASMVIQSYNFKKASKIIVNSKFLKSTVVKYYNLDPSKVEVIYTGVDTNLFTPRVKSQVLREKLELRKGEFVVLCVATIAPYKNQLSLIKTIPRVVRENPNTKFLLVGAIASKKYFLEIQEFVRQNLLNKYVLFVGPVSHIELPKYYALADVFVLLSTAEGMPATPLEAMSCGKPAILSSIPQNREIAIRGNEVIYVNPFDVEAIAEALSNLLRDSSLRKKLGENARRTILDYFEWEVIAKRMVKVFEEAWSESETKKSRNRRRLYLPCF